MMNQEMTIASDVEGGDEYNPDIIENEPHEGHEGNDEDNPEATTEPEVND